MKANTTRTLGSVAAVSFFAFLLLWAGFTGAIYRHEVPFWIVRGLDQEAAKPGVGLSDLLLTGALYLAYYAVPPA